MKYITIHLMGGLGNQLFQIFTTISLSLNNKIPFIFNYTDVLTTGIHRPTYWNTFLYSIKPFTVPNLNTHNYLTYKEPNFKFNSINIETYINENKKDGLFLYGYYQSYKYFQERYYDILKLLEFKEKQNIIKEKYSNYFNFEDGIIISLHFRLGDYKKKQHCHPIINEKYYIDSLNKIVNKLNINYKKITILYFCEKEDNNIVLDKINKINNSQTSQKYTFIKVDDTICDWEQMILMSCCHHNIIANSTFSWWGAYLNENPDKIVCYPSVWFGDKLKHDTKDLFPDKWIKV